MAEAELSILVQLRDDASAQLRALNDNIDSNTKSWRENYGAIQDSIKRAGIALAAFGAAVIGTFGMLYKAYEEDRVATEQFAVQLKNLGIVYEDVKVSLDEYMDATRKSTGITKDEQQSALIQLLHTTQDYDRALQLLPLSLDLAKSKTMDVTQSALLLGRVAEGDINVLNRYGFSMDGVTTAAQALNVVQGAVGGTAAGMVSPLQVLGTSFGELKVAIGSLISEETSGFITFATTVIDKIKVWIEKNPELAGTLADLGLALGAAALVVGTLSVAVITLGISLALLGGPVTLVLLAITLLVAAGIFLALKWDEVQAHWSEIWQGIKTALYIFMGPIGFAIGFLIDIAANFIEHWDTAKGFWANIWNEMKFIVLTFVNDIVGILNGPLDLINQLGKLIGQDWHIGIPKISEESWGIYTRPGGTQGTQKYYGPYLPEETSEVLTSPDVWGNYGNLGKTYNFGDITISIDGDNLNPEEIAEEVRRQLLLLQERNSTTGIR